MTRRNHKKPEQEAHDVNAFMREVEETMHSERLEQLWKTYKFHITASIVAVFAITAGFQWVDANLENRLQVESTAFWKISELSAINDENVSELAATGDKGYRTFANLTIAGNAANNGDVEGQMAQYNTIISDVTLPENYRNLVRFNKAMLLAETDILAASNIFDELKDTSYSLLASEFLGYLAEKENDTKKARGIYAAILTNGLTTDAMKQRVSARLDMIARLQSN